MRVYPDLLTHPYIFFHFKSPRPILTIISRKNQVGKLGVCLVVSGDLVVVRRSALSALGILDVTYVDLEYLLLGVQRVGLILKLFNQGKILFEHVWNVTLFLLSAF